GDEFNKLVAYPGSEQVLQNLFELFANGDVADPMFVLNAAALVDEAKHQFEETWKNYAWSNMRSAFKKPTTWQKLREDEASSFERLMAHCDDQQRADMLGALAFKLATMAEVVTNQPDFARTLADLCLAASKASNWWWRSDADCVGV